MYKLSEMKLEVLDRLMENLDGLSERQCNICDLSFELLEDENNQGYITPYEDEAREWSLRNFKEIEEILDNCDSEIADFIMKKFWDDVKGFQVCIYIEVARELINNLPLKYGDFWIDDEAKANIKEIIKETYGV